MIRIGVALSVALIALADSDPASAEDPARVQQLVAELKQTKKDRRLAALEQLRALGPEAKAAAPDLLLALKDKDVAVSINASAALAQIGPALKEVVSAKDALPALVGALEASDRKLRGLLEMNIAGILGNLAPEGIDAIPVLIGMIPGTSGREAAVALGRFGPSAKGAVAQLMEALNNPARFDRFDIAQALGQIGETKVALDVLVPGLRGEATPSQQKTYGAAGLPDPGSLIRFNAARALATLGPAAKDAIPAMAQALADPDGGVRATVAEALGNTRAPEALPHLRQALGHSDPFVRVKAAQALWGLGEIAPALAVLAEALKHEHRLVRREAAWALASYGPAAAEAVPALTAALAAEKDREIQGAMQESLRKIQGR